MNKMAKVKLNVQNSSQGVHLDLFKKRKRSYYRYMARKEKEKELRARSIIKPVVKPVITLAASSKKAHKQMKYDLNINMLKMEPMAPEVKVEVPTVSIFDVPMPSWIVSTK